jgi:hypothetical protein
MPAVRLTRDEAEGKLPGACACCGDPVAALNWLRFARVLQPAAA